MQETTSSITIYHNPRCGNSRNALALIQEAGFEPVVIEYLQTPPDKKTLQGLLKDMALTPRELMRSKETVYLELNLADETLTDDQLIESMLQHPILINRPIVVTPIGTRLCRPGELVRDILPT